MAPIMGAWEVGRDPLRRVGQVWVLAPASKHLRSALPEPDDTLLQIHTYGQASIYTYLCTHIHMPLYMCTSRYKDMPLYMYMQIHICDTQICKHVYLNKQVST